MTGQDAAKRGEEIAAVECVKNILERHQWHNLTDEMIAIAYSPYVQPIQDALRLFADAAVAEAVKPWREARDVQVAALNRLGLLGSPVEELERLAEAVKERDAEIERLRAEMGYHEAADVIQQLAQQRDDALALVAEARREERERANALAHVSKRYRDSEHAVGGSERLAMYEAARELRVRIAILESALTNIADEAWTASAMVSVARRALSHPASAPEGEKITKGWDYNWQPDGRPEGTGGEK